ncbi:MAG: hypothetical protein H6Q33_1623 [Deltaproteobacteria bacterium]|nr:hypothetical protein [Deltaproteobacteria bacterium]
MHDLDAVAVGKHQAAVIFPRDDFPIEFHGDPPLTESELRNEIGYRHSLGERVRLAIDDYLHAKNIVISGYLYNVEAIW